MKKSEQIQFLYCQKHAKKLVEWIKIKNINQNDQIFYCSDCQANSIGEQTQIAELMQIQNNVNNHDNEKSIIETKWPPIANQSLVQKLKSIIEDDNLRKEGINQINDFFNQIQDKIIYKIEDQRKKSLKEYCEITDIKEKIIEEYKQIFRIKDFKEIVFSNQNYNDKIQQCTDLIQFMNTQSELNTKKIKSFIEMCEYLHKIMNFQSANEIQKTIMNLFDQINLFFVKNNDGMLQNLQTTQEVIFERENCSILDVLKKQCDVHTENTLQQMNEINKLIEQIGLKFNNLNIQFEGYKNLEQNKSYYLDYNTNQLKESFSNNYDDSQKEDILPKFNLIATKFQQPENYIRIHKLNDGQIQITMSEDYGNVNCVSDFVLDKYSKYIFRFAIKPFYIEVFEGVWDYNNDSGDIGYDTYGQNCIVHQLKDDKRTGLDLVIGLTSDSIKDFKSGFRDNLSCNFHFNQNSSVYRSGMGIDKIEDRDISLWNELNIIEMRVCLADKTLEILDYPNFNYKLSVKEEFKNNLIEKQNLRLFVGLWQSNIKVEIIEAFKIG